MVDLQGQAAANNGIKSEANVASIISNVGGQVLSYRNAHMFDYVNEHTLLVKNKPYINMFGTKGKRDFYLTSVFLKNPISIEVRSQKVKGSASEKIPALFGNCKCMDTRDVIIVIEGDGHNPGTLRWLKNECSKEKDFNIKLMTIKVFESFIKKSFSPLGK